MSNIWCRCLKPFLNQNLSYTKFYLIGFVHSDFDRKNAYGKDSMEDLFNQLDLNINGVIDPTEVDESLKDFDYN